MKFSALFVLSSVNQLSTVIYPFLWKKIGDWIEEQKNISWDLVERWKMAQFWERERCLRGVLIGSSTRILSIILQIEACRNGLNNNNSRASTSLSEISAIERNLLESQLNTVLVICSFLLIDYLFMLWSLMTHVYTVWNGRWRSSKSLLSASSKQNLVMSFKHLLC